MTNAAKLPFPALGFPRGNRLAGPCGALFRRHGLERALAADPAADLPALGAHPAEVLQHFGRKLLLGHTSILNRVLDKSGKWEEEESEDLLHPPAFTITAGVGRRGRREPRFFWQDVYHIRQVAARGRSLSGVLAGKGRDT